MEGKKRIEKDLTKNTSKYERRYQTKTIRSHKNIDISQKIIKNILLTALLITSALQHIISSILNNREKWITIIEIQTVNVISTALTSLSW